MVGGGGGGGGGGTKYRVLIGEKVDEISDRFV